MAKSGLSNDVSQCLDEIIYHVNPKNYMTGLGLSYGDDDQGSDFHTNYEITIVIPVTLPCPVHH